MEFVIKKFYKKDGKTKVFSLTLFNPASDELFVAVEELQKQRENSYQKERNSIIKQKTPEEKTHST